MYTFAEAARLSGVSTLTVRNWFKGRAFKGVTDPPLFTHDSGADYVSFLQLIEVIVASKFRENRIPYRTVRAAYQVGHDEWGIAYPFAHLRLEALGGHIIHVRHGSRVQAVDAPPQWTLFALVGEEVKGQLDYAGEFASRWHPVGKDVPIVVDPMIGSGLPTINGRGVTLASLRKRWTHGHSMQFIAEDFNLSLKTVEDALRFADRVAA